MPRRFSASRVYSSVGILLALSLLAFLADGSSRLVAALALAAVGVVAGSLLVLSRRARRPREIARRVHRGIERRR